MNKLIFLFFLLFSGLSSCKKWNLDEVNFLQVYITEIKPEASDVRKLIISGKINDLIIDDIADHGFLLNEGEQTPDIYLNDKKYALNKFRISNDPFFSDTISGLSPNTTYTFRAYAETMEKVFYSDTMSYTTGTGMVTTDSFYYRPNTTILELYGKYSSVEGAIALQNGFCWSRSNTSPTLEDEYLNALPFIPTPIKATFEDLEQGVMFYFRAFTIIRYISNSELDTLYGNSKSFDGMLDYWIPKNDFPLDNWDDREGVVNFSIDIKGKGYVGLGISLSGVRKDFWMYDPEEDNWTQICEFPGEGRQGAVGFSINDRGYVGTGGYPFPMEDFWEYDPVGDTWSELPDFGGSPRSYAVGFPIDGKGYIGTGQGSFGNELYNDFYEYNPMDSTWVAIDTLPALSRAQAVGFSIDDKGYVGLGCLGDCSGSMPGPFPKDFYMYDPVEENWVPIEGFPPDDRNGNDNGRSNAVAFSINNKGYVGTGYNDENELHFKDFYEYDPTNNQPRWVPMNNLPWESRTSAVGFSINNVGYFGLGKKDSEYVYDFWSFEK